MADGRMNLMEVRQLNKQSIVRMLHERGSLTKRELTEVSGLSLATVATILRELMEEGVVERGRELESTGGRRPIVFQIVPNARAALGITLTPNHIRMALVNWMQEVVDQYRETIPCENTEAYWEHIRVLVKEAIERVSLADGALVSINIALDGAIIPGGSYEDIVPGGIFRDLDMQRIRSMYDCRVTFCNSLKAAAFSNIGTKSERNTCVYLQLDRTIGGAVIAEGTFWGLSNRTGEFGHMYIGEGSRKCSCGSYGCMQTFCSSSVLREESGMEPERFFEEIEGGNADPALQAIWDRYLDKLVRAVYNLRVIFDIDVMIGGEMASFLERQEQLLQERLWEIDLYGEKIRYLRFSSGGEYEGAIGAALMALQM